MSSQQETQIQTINNPFTSGSLRNDNALVFTYKLAKYTAVKKPVIAISWTLGLILLFFIGGMAIPEEKLSVFNNKMDQVNKQSAALDAKNYKLQQAYNKYYNSKGYFFTCDAICNKNYQAYLQEQQKFDQQKQTYIDKQHDMKSDISIFSDYSVSETKDLFWNINKEGNESAKRMSYFDMIFTSIGMLFDRDREIAEVIFQLIFNFISNILINNIITFVRFTWNIIWQVLSYSPNPVEGGIFLLLSLIAACSWFFAYNYVLFLIGRGAVNVALDMSNAQRIQNGDRQNRRQQHINYQYQQRPHYD